MLHTHIVGKCNVGIAPAVERRDAVTRRGGDTAAEHVHDDDKVAARVKYFIWRNQPFHVLVSAAVVTWANDNIRLVRREYTIGLVGEFGIKKDDAGLQR